MRWFGSYSRLQKVDMFKQIQESMYAYANKNVTPVIIIDEVQFISNSILDDLRLILNVEMDSKNLCAVILAGQPKLVFQLNRQNHEALRQRIIINYTFAGLTREETKEYIISRLKACGVYEPIFQENSYESYLLPPAVSSEKSITLSTWP